MATTLRQLLDEIKDGKIELTDKLPVFGDREWDNPTGVWSWNQTHQLVGTCVDDLEIVPRNDVRGTVIQAPCQ